MPGDELAFANAKYKVYLGPDDPDMVEYDAGTEVMMAMPKRQHDEDRMDEGDDDDGDVRPAKVSYSDSGDVVPLGKASQSDVRLLSDSEVHENGLADDL